MKKIVEFDKEVGGDGAKVAGVLKADEGYLVASVEAKYPLEKVLLPVEQAVDHGLDELKKLIPGNLEDPAIEGFKVAYKAKLKELLGAL